MVGNSQVFPDTGLLEDLRRSLLTWYAGHRREMPWRDTRDPYAVWISEIMLQQTRVDQVIPYYERFMSRFPTVQDLGRAPLDEVLKTWEGLGYYARARNIHRAAKQIVARHGGRIPDDPGQISALPGIGPYTSGAILSIAYGMDRPVLDGNVVRVLSRLFHITDDPAVSATKKRMASLAERLLAKGRAGDFNQAMMELGATICTPRQPGCGECPVATHCIAGRTLSDPSVLPYKKQRKQRPHHHVDAGVVSKGEELLIVRRPLEGLLGGLWEFPGGIATEGADREDQLVKELKRVLGIDIRVDRAFATVKHAFTHFEITLRGYFCTHLGGDARHREGNDCQWVRMGGLKDYAFPRAHNRLIEAMSKDAESRQKSLLV